MHIHSGAQAATLLWDVPSLRPSINNIVERLWWGSKAAGTRKKQSSKIKEQRIRLKETQRMQIEKPSTVNQDRVTREWKKLQEPREDDMNAFFQNKITKINNAPDSCHQGKAWAVMNHITNIGRSLLLTA